MVTVPENWREWGLGLAEQPEIVARLEGGQTNSCYLLNSNNRRLILRFNAKNSAALGIDRHVEAKILAATSSAGLSPGWYYCNPEAGFLVTDYLPSWRPQPFESRHLKQLAATIRQVHQLDVDVPAVSYIAYTEQYVERLRQRQGKLSKPQSVLRDRELPFVEAFQSEAGDQPYGGPRLCHHDPTPDHWRQYNGQLCLIDWEYAALRDPACDLALLAQGWHLNSEQEQRLLHYYGPGISPRRFGDAKRVCAYVDRLWFEIQALK